MTDTMQLRKQNSGGFGSSGSSQENLSNVMYNAANYNTIMVEYENGNREMAVDVPASFVAQVLLIIRLEDFSAQEYKLGLLISRYSYMHKFVNFSF